MNRHESRLLTSTDKVFWHKYMPFYHSVLNGILPEEDFDIAEIGVFNSKSIAYWRQHYPASRITGCDINYDPTWYIDSKVRYLRFDQSDYLTLFEAFKQLKNPRILIDDGSHIPYHQMIFLHVSSKIISMMHPTQKRIVILKDLHTSLERIIHSNCQQESIYANEQNDEHLTPRQESYKRLSDAINPMALLLSLEKVKSGSQSKQDLIHQFRSKIPSDYQLSLITEIAECCLKADRISIYRRSTLPDFCFKCGCKIFDISSLRCEVCGEDGYKYADSITTALEYNIAA